MTRPLIEPLPLLTTGQLAQRYGVHRDTVWDWIRKGVDAPGGVRVRLKAWKIGGMWKSTVEEAEAFFAALAGPEHPTPVAESPAAAKARARRDQEEALKVLGGKRRKAG